MISDCCGNFVGGCVDDRYCPLKKARDKIAKLENKLSEVAQERDSMSHLLQQHDAHWHEVASFIGTDGGWGGCDGPVWDRHGTAQLVIQRIAEKMRKFNKTEKLLEMAYRSHVQRGYELNPGRWVAAVQKIITHYIPEKWDGVEVLPEGY